MKKSGVFNSDISKIIAEMGHTDMLAVVDMGFPIARDVEKVDLVVDKGKPGFIEVVEIILRELHIEEIILAEEIKEKNPQTERELIDLAKSMNKNLKVAFISHEELKRLSRNAKGVVRTGEDKPYSNVILVSGVIF